MEKDPYCYEPYPPTKSTTNSLKRDNDNDKRKKKMNIDSSSGGGGNNRGRCQCFGRKHKSKARTFLTGLATNLGICILLFGYTLIGSIIFLAIEGGNSLQQLKTTTTTTQILATRSMSTSSTSSITTTTTTTTKANQDSSSSNKGGNGGGKLLINYSDVMKMRNDEARARTVENIWDITVSLNILYRDNWTRLAAQEITRFQDELMKSLNEELALQQQQQKQQQREEQPARKFIQHDHYEWTFAKAFLYSLTVLTTIGYGSIAPRTTLGKTVTMIYAMLGIPLTLLYLSSIGSILSRVARGVFSRALCCCLCSNCGYCCYDEKRMAEKERRMKKKRQQLELQQQQQQQQQQLQEPFYVRSNSLHNNLLHSPQLNDNILINNSNNLCSNNKEIDNLSCTDNESKTSSMHGLSILAPILLCLAMMFIYICLGTFILYKLENLTILDGFYFCFMSLTTIGFGDMIPGTLHTFHNHNNNNNESNTTIWFCSIYIMSGMALTAMCFNVVHDEIVHRLKHQQHHHQQHQHIHKLLPKLNSQSFPDDLNITDPYNTMTS